MKFYPTLSIAVLAVVLLLISAGCVTVSQPDPSGTIWTLTSFGASNDAPHGIISLSFDSGSISGSTGINTYTASYTSTSTSGGMTVSTIGMTKMSGTAALAADETRYIEALGKTSAYSIQNGVLTLRDSSGIVLLTFGNPLADTSWRLVSYTPVGAVTESTVLGMATASFAADGRISGLTGINTYTAAWTLNQSTLTISSLSSSKALGSAELVSQEQFFLTLLGSVSGLSFSSGHLILTDGAGTPIMTFAPILADTTWVLTGINGSSLASTYPDTTLILASDGTLSGASAVNLYFGTWHQTGISSVNISGIGTTLILGAPDVTAAEQRYLGLLSGIESFEITESDLILANVNGGTLHFTVNYADLLKGTTWSLTGNNDVTLFIVENGASLNGIGQINTYGADLTLTPAGEFSIRNFYSTKMTGPATLVSAENQYFSSLKSAASCMISSSRLILLDASQNMILRFNPGI